MYNTKHSNISFAKEILVTLLISKSYVISLCTYLVYVYLMYKLVHSVVDFTLRMQLSGARAVQLKVFDGPSTRQMQFYSFL